MMVQDAMIWGTGGGIGRALVSRLGEEGWRVLAMNRHTTDPGDLCQFWARKTTNVG